MKLPIRKKYFDQIKAGKKLEEYRDSHITFVCEETGETLRKEIASVSLVPTSYILKRVPDLEKDMFEDSVLMSFEFKEERE